MRKLFPFSRGHSLAEPEGFGKITQIVKSVAECGLRNAFVVLGNVIAGVFNAQLVDVVCNCLTGEVFKYLADIVWVKVGGSRKLF